MMQDDLIADKVIESLEKMARPHASMGRGANAALIAYANQMKNKDVEMMRDALAHHISHYKSALKNGNRAVADQHLEKIVPLMHLAGRASSHSGGQLGLDYVPLEPWESNYTTVDRRPETGKLIEGTKGLGRRPKKRIGESKYGVSRSVPDYRYLEMQPHGGHQDAQKSPHKGGYPFEEIQLGNPAKIDAKEAYLPIEDVGPQESFVPHPFDAHPVHGVADLKQDSLSPDKMKNFADAMQNWHQSEHNAKWMQGVKDIHAKDPEAFKARGKMKPEHHFKDLQLMEQPAHAKAHSTAEVQPKKPALSSEDVAALPEHLKSKVAAPAAPAKPKASGLSEQELAALPEHMRIKFGGGK